LETPEKVEKGSGFRREGIPFDGDLEFKIPGVCRDLLGLFG